MSFVQVWMPYSPYRSRGEENTTPFSDFSPIGLVFTFRSVPASRSHGTVITDRTQRFYLWTHPQK